MLCVVSGMDTYGQQYVALCICLFQCEVESGMYNTVQSVPLRLLNALPSVSVYFSVKWRVVCTTLYNLCHFVYSMRYPLYLFISV